MFYRGLLRNHLKNILSLHLPKCSYFNRQLHLLSGNVNRRFSLKFCSFEYQKSFKSTFPQNHPNLINDSYSEDVNGSNFPPNGHNFPITIYPETENENFHQILRKNVCYSHLMMRYDNTIAHHKVLKKHEIQPHIEDFLSNLDNYSNFKIFAELTKLTSLSLDKQENLFTNEKFIQLCDILTNRLSELNNEELFCLMQVLIKFNFRSCITPILRPLRMKISSRFDNECMKRAPQFTTAELFQICDFFFYFRYNKQSKFCQFFFKLIQNKSLSNPELVLALFYANLSRNIPVDFVNKTLESVALIAKSLTLEEMAIVCLGFFKTKYQIRNIAFLETLAEKLHTEINGIEPITVSALFKGLQISTSKTIDKSLPRFFSILSNVLDSVSKEILHYPPTTFMHVFLYFHFIHFVNNDFIANVKERLSREDISQWRIKDIARISYSVANLGPSLSPMPEFWDKIIQDLESPARQVEIKRYPQCLLSTLIGLSFVGIYPTKLIDQMFQPATLASFDLMRKTSRLDFRRDLFQLNESVRIECPDYDGHSLPDNFLSTLAKNHEIFGKLPDIKTSFKTVSQRDTYFFEIVLNLNKLFKNKKKYSIDFLLPHFQTADIEIRLDVEGEAVPCKLWKSSETKTVEIPAMDNHLTDLLIHLTNRNTFQRLALVLFGPNSYCRIYDPEKESISYHLLGFHLTKLRQLEKKGFKIVEIPYFEFPTGPQQLDYLRQKIFDDQSK